LTSTAVARAVSYIVGIAGTQQPGDLLPLGQCRREDYPDLLPGAERAVRVQSTKALEPAWVGVTCANAVG
jgi:hypothetical protein